MTKATDFIAALQLEDIRSAAELASRIAQTLCNYLDVESVIVGMPINAAATRIKVVAAAANGLIAPKFEYELAETPCLRVYEDNTVFYPCDLDRLYPIEAPLGWKSYAAVPIRQLGETGVKGHLAAFSVRPLANKDEAIEVLQVAANLIDVASLREIDEAKVFDEGTVRRSPDVDRETGLGTIGYLEARGKAIFENCVTAGIPLCIGVVEIARIGQARNEDSTVNQMIGSIARTHVGPHSGLAARIGTNDYAILLPGASLDQLQYLLVTIDVAIKHAFTMFTARWHYAPTRMSSGAAVRLADDDSFGQLLRRAQMDLFSRNQAERLTAGSLVSN